MTYPLTGLPAAGENTTAREVWVVWVKRGFGAGIAVEPNLEELRAEARYWREGCELYRDKT